MSVVVVSSVFVVWGWCRFRIGVCIDKVAEFRGLGVLFRVYFLFRLVFVCG